MNQVPVSHQDTSSKDAFRLFLILMVGAFINSIGSGLTNFVLTVSIYQVTGSTNLMSQVLVIGLLPKILLGPFAGALVDRYDRRSLLLIGDGLSGLGVLLIYWQFQQGQDFIKGLPIILSGLAISSVFSTLTVPALKASVSDILPEESFSKAASFLQLVEAANLLISPLLASLLLLIIPIGQILLLDILTIFVTIFCTYLVKKHLNKQSKLSPDQVEDSWKMMIAGWDYLKVNRHVFLLISYVSLLTFCLGFIQVLITPILLNMTDSKGYGLVMTLAATGMLAGASYLTIHPIKEKFKQGLVLSLMIAGCLVIGIGMINHLILITGLAFALFFSLAFANTIMDYLIRMNAPSEYLGRVLGFAGQLSQLSYLLAFQTAGILADKWFNPLLLDEGPLANSLGQIFGVGPGRGSGLLTSLAGLGLLILAYHLKGHKYLNQIKE